MKKIATKYNGGTKTKKIRKYPSGTKVTGPPYLQAQVVFKLFRHTFILFGLDIMNTGMALLPKDSSNCDL